MRRSNTWISFLFLFGLTARSATAQNTAPFELRDGDRVVFVGDTLIEREQSYGYLERNLTVRFADRNVTFRNLGWSADTPQGQSRVSFEWRKSPEEWFTQLKKQIADIQPIQPTVVFIGYGMANSFDGSAALLKFKADLNKLIDAILEINRETRFVLLSPIRHENLGPPLPDPAKHNEQLALYTQAIREIAGQRAFWFVSLFDLLGDGAKTKPARPYTDNGIHLTGYGYQKAAQAIERALGWKPMDLDRGLKARQAEELRQAILKKNELFFHRWRPENSTYLFLFRKHEQGQNAREIPMFDPLVQAEEAKIARLRKLDGPKPALEKKKSLSSRTAAISVVPQHVPEFQVEPGYEISLYAENPQLAKPIHMNFDAQGRLWVASSSVYPQIQPGQVADDKILVLEDTDGDGHADKSTVFADGLLIPTGVAPGDGGAYVAQSTELLHLKDTNGDGKADQKRVVLSGFGTEDTHHILHTLRWGHDGQLYMNQSIYIHTHTETPHGVVRLNSGGILNLRPSTMELGIHMKGLVNSWGHDFDNFGQSFVTDGAGGAGINYVVPQAMYETYAGARRILGSVSPGNYPKFCGLEIVESQHFPEEWRGNLITCDFRAHRVARFSISEQGSAYVTKEMPDLVRTKEATFRPIDAKIGPDGALYIADWSNPIIQHGEVDFRDPRRDHEHGRIWRVTAKGRPLLPKPKLVNSSNTDLLDQLLSPNSFNRQHARLVLTERGKKVASDLAKWTRKQTTDTALLEALWMHQAIDAVEPKLLEKLLSTQDGRIRAAAVRVLSFWQEGGARTPPIAGVNLTFGANRRAEIPSSRALELLAARIVDDHPRVRLEALRALAKIPTARAAELALSVLDKPLDRHLDYTLWLTINDLAEPWLASLQSGEWKTEGREKQLEFGLKSIEPSQASVVIGQLLKNKPLSKDGSGPWIELIGQSGGPKELRRLFDQVLQGGFDEGASARALGALNQATRVRSTKPTGELTAVGDLFSHPSEQVRVAAVRLAGGWKELGKYFGDLVTLAGGPATPPAVRQAAFDSLRDIGGQGALDGLVPLSAKGVNGTVRRQAVVVLSALKLDQGVPPAIETLSDTASEEEALALWRSLLNIKGAASALAKALPKSGIATMMAKTGLRAAREGGRNEPDLVLALTRGGDLSEGEVALTEAELKQLVADVASKGDASRGELVYRRKELSCVACHAIGGAGGKVGPDMTSLGASAPSDYLIESVWFPNKKIKEGYHAILVETKDGQEFSGVLVRETNEQLVVRDATNQEISVPKNNVKTRTTSTMSLMPAGLIDYLTAQERIDLFRFLSELGKPGAYDASKGNVARVWKLRPGTHEAEQFGEEKVVRSDLNGPGWFPVYSMVDGRLVGEQLEDRFNLAKHVGVVGVYAAAQLEMAKAGPVRLKFSGVTNATVWIDGQPVKPGSELSSDLTPGTHTIVVRLDPKRLPENLRLESSEGTFLVN